MKLRRVPGWGVDANRVWTVLAMPGDGRTADLKRRSSELFTVRHATTGAARDAARACERQPFM